MGPTTIPPWRSALKAGMPSLGGRNYGQRSSREHAALAPRSLGLHLVIAKGVARIHWQNLVNFGVLPLIFMDTADYDRLGLGDVIRVEGIHAAIKSGPKIPVKNLTRKLTFVARHGPVGPAGRCLHGWRIDKLEKSSAMTIPIWR
jgi:3-isopropylmalate dehydratase small subunit